MSYKRTLKKVSSSPKDFMKVLKNGQVVFNREEIRELCKCSDGVARAVKSTMEREYASKQGVEL